MTVAGGSAEEVFACGADDSGRGFSGWLVAVAPDEDGGKAFGFAHEQAGGCGELVGNGEHRGGQGLSVAVARAPQIVEDGDAERADGYIGESEPPGAAEGIADDDGDALSG